MTFNKSSEEEEDQSEDEEEVDSEENNAHRQTSQESYQDPKHLVFKKIAGAGLSGQASKRTVNNRASNLSSDRSSQVGHEVHGDQTNPHDESFSSGDSN